MNEFDTMCMSDIICPYCGHVFSVTYSLIEVGYTECQKCEKPFNLFIKMVPEYSTYKLEEDEQ